MYAIWGKVRAKPESRQRILAALTDSALTAERAEPGCLRFNVFRDAQDENVYYLLECYKDEAAFEAHKATPYYAAWRAVASLREEPTEVIRCQPIVPADPAYWGDE